MMDKRVCEGCKHYFYDNSTGASDCGKEDTLTEEAFEKYFIDGEEDCPCFESSYDPSEEAYLEKMMADEQQDEAHDEADFHKAVMDRLRTVFSPDNEETFSMMTNMLNEEINKQAERNQARCNQMLRELFAGTGKTLHEVLSQLGIEEGFTDTEIFNAVWQVLGDLVWEV